jgi:uncharacterized protein (TIGR00730 family)
MHHIQLSKTDILQKNRLTNLINEKKFRVAIFGSARVKSDDLLYKEIYDFGKIIANKWYDIVTWGWPGVMEAASRGHHAGCENCLDTKTIGINIQLPWEQNPNPYLDISETSPTFSNRLDTFMLLSDVFVIAPGWIGTLLELFYTWQLMQVHHICKTPIILWGEAYLELKKFIQTSLVEKWFVSQDEADLAMYAKNMDQVYQLIDMAHDSYNTLGEKACINVKQYIAWARNLWIID